LAIAKRKIRRKYYNRIPAITNRFTKRTNTGRQNQEEIKIIIAEIIKRFQYEEGFTNIILKQTQKLKISKYS
jgi:hypothetical protein